MKFRVTIGLCVKNAEMTIDKTIESIINQNFPNKYIEIIVVDGNSQDKTLTIVKKRLKKSGIAYKIFSENQGLGYARQIVVENASGDYILWVDGDMILPKNYLQDQVKFMDSHSRVAIAEGTFRNFHGKGLVETLENIEWSVNCIDKSQLLQSKGMIMRPCCGGSIFRTDAIKQIGGFDVKIKGAGEDEDAAFRILEFGWKVYSCTPSEFFNRRSETFKDLWKEQLWYGYGAHYLIHKRTKMFGLTPFFFGFTQSIKAYRLTYNKVSFLLPIHYYFKKLAQMTGFLKAHIHGYGHEL